MNKSRHVIKIKPGRFALILIATAVVLILLSLIGQYFRLFPDTYSIKGPTQEFFLDLFIEKFFVNSELNIPTYFNTAILAIAAVLSFFIASAKHAVKDKFRFGWSLLAFVFLYLSMDEAVVIHEKFSALFKDAPDVGGWLHYKWVIPAMVILVILGLVFLRFFLHLDNRFKGLFLGSATLYVLGALGGELFSGRYANTFGTKNFTYSAMTHGEEGLEYLGVILMIFTLLTYIKVNFSEISFSGEETPQDTKK